VLGERRSLIALIDGAFHHCEAGCCGGNGEAEKESVHWGAREKQSAAHESDGGTQRGVKSDANDLKKKKRKH